MDIVNIGAKEMAECKLIYVRIEWIGSFWMSAVISQASAISLGKEDAD